jgi:ABC-type bacteriocin/lantibiotic exporter with double-glycine peptidase domain
MALAQTLFEMIGFGLVFAVLTVVVSDEKSIGKYIGIDSISQLPRETQVVLVGLVMVLVIVVKHVFSLFAAWYQSGALGQISIRLTDHAFSVLLTKPYEEILNFGAPAHIIRVQNSAIVTSGVVTPALSLITDGTTGVALIAILLWVEPLPTLVVMLTLTFTSAFFLRFSRPRLAHWGAAQALHRSEALRQLQDGIFGMKEFRVMQREGILLQRHRESLSEMNRMNRGFVVTQQVPRAMLEIVSVVGVVLLIVIMTLQDRAGREILPVLGLFAAGAFRFAPSITKILSSIQQIQYSIPVVSELLDDLSAKSKVHEVRPENARPLFESLNLKNVTFRYRGANDPTLRDISLLVERGETIGITGESGSGKTTLLDLSLGLLQPTRGSVLVNNQNLERSIGNWYRMIGYVPQNVFLVDGSIKENVCLGIDSNEVDDCRIWEVLDLAQLSGFVSGLPDGLESRVGDRGTWLSGGQRQRIGIARALYQQPQVLFFDEATSALDRDTEENLLSAIANLRENYTIVMVTHRSAPLRICDRVVLVSGGFLTVVP